MLGTAAPQAAESHSGLTRKRIPDFSSHPPMTGPQGPKPLLFLAGTKVACRKLVCHSHTGQGPILPASRDVVASDPFHWPHVPSVRSKEKP